MQINVLLPKMQVIQNEYYFYRLPDGQFHVECDIDIRFNRIGLHESLEVVPILEYEGCRLELPILVLMGWRRYFGFIMSCGGNSRCFLLKEYRIGRILCVSVLDCLCGRVRCRYEANVDYQPWMDQVGIRIVYD